MKPITPKRIKTLIAGTFDNFHVGHQWFIWQAFKQSETLCIIVARDATVQCIKGNSPKKSETKRLQRLSTEVHFEPNIKVRLGRADADFWQTLREENPDLIILGYDQHVKEADILKHFPQIKIQRCREYHPHIFKSSKF